LRHRSGREGDGFGGTREHLVAGCDLWMPVRLCRRRLVGDFPRGPDLVEGPTDHRRSDRVRERRPGLGEWRSSDQQHTGQRRQAEHQVHGFPPRWQSSSLQL